VASRGVELQVLRLSERPASRRAPASGVECGESWLESGRYRLELDGSGALASLVDKRLDRELLAAPAALELFPDRSTKYPAWEIHWRDVAAPARERVDRLTRLDLVERGPLRAALAVERTAPGVAVRETWRLAAGSAGEVVSADVEIDWRRRARLLKATFPLAAANPVATYDTGLDGIERPLSDATLYEVPAQHWAALEDAAGEFGVALFADCRHGWDHPDERTLRSTWIHAPRASLKWRHQATQDFGRHRLRFGVAGLATGDLRDGRAAALADRFVHLPRAFHLGTTGDPDAARRRTLVAVARPLRLLALKAAEDGDEAVLRVSNPTSRPHELAVVSELAGFDALRAASGMEEISPRFGDSPRQVVAGGGLATRLTRALRPSLHLGPAGAPLALPWSVRGTSRNGERPGGGGFDGRGRFLPRELLPARLVDTVVPFDLAHVGGAAGDVAVARGQLLELPPDAAEVWLLAAAVGGERSVAFTLDDSRFELLVPDWRAPLLRESRWRRSLGGRRLEPGLFLRRPTAWSCGHLHDRAGEDLAVERAILFALRVPVAGARVLRLPEDAALRLLAATVAARPARPLASAEPPFPA
jgi:alpha-mannosidase